MEHALRLSSGFAPWPPALMARLIARSQVQRHAPDELVGSETGAPWTFFVISGHVLVSRTPPGGRRAAVTMLGPGSLVGLVRVLEGPEVDGEVAYDFSARVNTVVARMPTAEIRQLLDEQPALWRDMTLMLMKQHRQVLETLLTARMGSFSERLTATLERLAALYGSDDGNEVRIGLRLTQEDLAALLQVTRQSVNKALRRLADAGAISLGYNAIAILDRETLRRHSGGVL